MRWRSRGLIDLVTRRRDHEETYDSTNFNWCGC
jgi:hypothetical protein